MIPLSAVIITYNEERNLPRLLDSLAFLEDIVVVDSGSTDRTVEIARERGCRVFHHEMKGFGDQKQYSVDQASQPWVLSIDADEEVGPELRAAIEAVDWRETNRVYRLQRLNFYLGRWIHHTEWRRDRPVRLFHRETARYNANLVHESLEHAAEVHQLAGHLKHYPYGSIGEHLAKIEHYTRLQAEEGSRDYGPLALLTRPSWKLFKNLILHQGFRDGWQGLVVCGMATVYAFLKVVRVLERKYARPAH